MSSTNTDHADASGALVGGVIREDVMNKIWDISDFPLPYTDAIGKGTHSNRKVEWTENTLAAPATNNAVIDGADVAQNNAALPTRLANYTQISVKEVQLSHSVQAADSIGQSGSMSYQITERQKELRRDVEAQMLTHQASVAGDGSTTAGISAGIGAQLKTNVSFGATGAVGGFNTTTGLFVAPTPGTKRALSEKIIRDILQGIYQQGGNTDMLMARPVVIRLLSEYMFTSTAKVATMTTTTNQPGAPKSAMAAYGAVNVFITDFGQTVRMVANRLQAADASATSSMYMLDPMHLRQSMLRGYQTEPLAKTGLSDKMLMSVEYSMLVLNEKSQGAILAIDEALAVVA
jgi:hypothetical protein